MDDAKFYQTLHAMARDPRIQAMQHYPQHGSSDSYHHSIMVAEYAFLLAKKLHIAVKEEELARGAMLHDFYLYNIRESHIPAWKHGTQHAKRALVNAEEQFSLTKREKDIIYSHMWPLNITHLPHYRESVLVGIADKYSALVERTRQILK